MLCVVALGPPRLTTISIDECIMPSDQFQKEGKNREELLSLIPSTVFQSHFSKWLPIKKRKLHFSECLFRKTIDYLFRLQLVVAWPFMDPFTLTQTSIKHFLSFLFQRDLKNGGGAVVNGVIFFG